MHGVGNDDISEETQPNYKAAEQQVRHETPELKPLHTLRLPNNELARNTMLPLRLIGAHSFPQYHLAGGGGGGRGGSVPGSVGYPFLPVSRSGCALDGARLAQLAIHADKKVATECSNIMRYKISKKDSSS